METAADIESGQTWNAAPERPWSRLTAKLFDVAFFMALTQAFFYALFHLISADQALSVQSGTLALNLTYEGAGYTFAAAIFWPMAEAICISLFGSTPGKAILNIRIGDIRGKTLPLWRSIKRSYGALVLGLGLLLPFVSFATAIWSYRRLKQTGQTYWDSYAAAAISSRPAALWRWVMLFVLLLLTGARLQVTPEADLVMQCCTW